MFWCWYRIRGPWLPLGVVDHRLIIPFLNRRKHMPIKFFCPIKRSLRLCQNGSFVGVALLELDVFLKVMDGRYSEQNKAMTGRALTLVIMLR